DLLKTQLPELAELSGAGPEGTYLAWLDARETRLADPAAEALRRAKIMVNQGSTFAPKGFQRYDGFVRLNFGTSAERLERIVKALSSAWS
ncbi:MAG TPA: hypothetical protein VLL08_09665, partial [Kineosporiaceae bacterium]|nr:hypothetical protein [Kineosporiaceae bacterium]